MLYHGKATDEGTQATVRQPSYSVRWEQSVARSGVSSGFRSESSLIRAELSRASSVHDLLVDLEPELVRGVPIHFCLRRFGREWRQVASPEALKWRPHLSRRTQRYQYFFSHDWGTSGLLKYLSLLVFFNGWPAAVVSLAMSVLITVLKVTFMPEYLANLSWFWPVVQHALAMLVLFFWQHVTAALGSTRLAFLDRLCIPQHDEEIKHRCIYALASFLSHSDNLVVLWSPRYCTRLWCMYELATFLLKKKQADRIQFVPVQTAVLWFLCYFFSTSLVMTALVLQRMGPDFSTTEGIGPIFLVAIGQIWVIFPLLLYLMTDLLHDMGGLVRQLRDFKLQHASCFCCSINHLHPVTQQRLGCDRKLIYGVLQRWSGQSGMDAEFGLDEEQVEELETVFAAHVQEHLIPSVEQTFTSSAFVMRLFISAALVGYFPFLSNFNVYDFRNIQNAGFPIYFMFVPICLLRVSLLIAEVGARRWGSSGCQRFWVFKGQMLLFIVVVLVVAAAYPLLAFIRVKNTFLDYGGTSMLPFIATIVFMVWGVYLLLPRRWLPTAIITWGSPTRNRKKPQAEVAKDEHEDEHEKDQKDELFIETAHSNGSGSCFEI